MYVYKYIPDDGLTRAQDCVVSEAYFVDRVIDEMRGIIIGSCVIDDAFFYGYRCSDSE